ncbi:MAG: methylated-DNA--[protein]-cysteine S-methyltransferase [Actinomycetota bacterium]|nr:methylated-DNA--[protein]-cysteine S-methyltransferase [Actinomycetota bacterium]
MSKIKYHLWGKPLAELSAAAKRLEPAAVEARMPVDLRAALHDYFNGVRTDLGRWNPDSGGLSAFAAGVYKATRSLKWGETASYSDIAAVIGSPGATRAVGAALGRNPTPLFVPCHRVLASSGEGGWSGPPGLKAKLLALEGGERS